MQSVHRLLFLHRLLYFFFFVILCKVTIISIGSSHIYKRRNSNWSINNANTETPKTPHSCFKTNYQNQVRVIKRVQMLLGTYSSHRFIFDTSIDEELRLTLCSRLKIVIFITYIIAFLMILFNLEFKEKSVDNLFLFMTILSFIVTFV